MYEPPGTVNVTKDSPGLAGDNATCVAGGAVRVIPDVDCDWLGLVVGVDADWLTDTADPHAVRVSAAAIAKGRPIRWDMR